MDVLCTFKIKIESQHSEHSCIKDQWPSENKIKIPTPSQEPSASSKAPNQAIKDTDVFCTFKAKKGSQNFDLGVKETGGHIQIQIKTPPSNSHIRRKPQIRTYRTWMFFDKPMIQIFRHLQNQDSGPIFGSTGYQKPVTISKSRSRFLTKVRSVQCPQML